MREAEKSGPSPVLALSCRLDPANLASTFASRTTGFALKLASPGFAHTHEHADSGGRIQFECFPHIVAIGIPRPLPIDGHGSARYPG
jgi:predicted RNase H-like nuclease